LDGRLVVEIDLELVVRNRRRNRLHHGGICRGQLGRLGSNRWGLANLRNTEADRSERQFITWFQDPLTFDLLAVDEGSVGTPEVLHHQEPFLLEELAMLATDLGGLDPNVA